MKPAEAGVLDVLRAMVCLYVLRILEIRSWRSKFGLTSSGGGSFVGDESGGEFETDVFCFEAGLVLLSTDVTVRNVERSKRTISSALMASAKACRNLSITERFGINLCTIPAHAL